MLMAALALAVSAACAPPVLIVRDPSLSIGRGATWHWGAPDGTPTVDQLDARVCTPAVQACVTDAVETELARRGFRKVPADSTADFTLHVHIGARTATARIPAERPPCGSTLCDPGIAWGAYGAPEAPEREVAYTEGSLIIDVHVVPGTLAWRGSSDTAVLDPGMTEQRMAALVRRILARFPDG